MAKNEKQVCAYLENMAAKVGGDVRVLNTSGHLTMYRNGDFINGVRVSLDDTREVFAEKVRKLMEG